MKTVARVNRALRLAGREERLTRGRGYYYLHDGDAATFPASALYVQRLESTPRDFALACDAIENLFRQAGIELELDRRS